MLTIAKEAALEAGRFLQCNLGKVKHVERKLGQETNLVTEIDRRAEMIIIKKIKQHYPSHDILAEESGAHRIQSEYRWVIDPLDGTTNYTHGLPIFCVSIGVEHNGVIIAAAIYDPSANELFTAEKGRGAYLNGKRIHVSTCDSLITSLLVTGFPYNIRDNPSHAVEHFVNLLMEGQGVRRLGSAALDLAYVAAGRLDGFWEVTLNPWDKAAGMLLVQEAGGLVTDFKNSPASIYDASTLATNGRIHAQMLAVLGKSL